MKAVRAVQVKAIHQKVGRACQRVIQTVWTARTQSLLTVNQKKVVREGWRKMTTTMGKVVDRELQKVCRKASRILSRPAHLNRHTQS